MKKLVLSAALLTLFPTLCWGEQNCEKTSIIIERCTREHPYLSEEIHLDYFYPPEIKFLTKLNLLEKRKDTSNYSSKFECHDPDDPLCQKLKKIEEYFKKMDKEEKILDMENQKIIYNNRIIEEKNAFFSYQQNIYKDYQAKIKVGKRCVHLGSMSFVPGGKTNFFIYEEPPTLKKWLELSDTIIQEYESILERNQKIREKNLEIEKENEKIEKENAEIEKQFWAYYTPEKMLQLSYDYDQIITEKCVGCDYPKPLDLDEYDCKECPNREFVDGKCILKKEGK